jgi:hypothetical protein
MLAEGRNFQEVARELGLSRNTVRRFARAISPEELLVNDGTGRQTSILHQHQAYLRERWNSGCTNAARLWQELRDRGYQGGPSYVRQYLARFRGNVPAPGPKPAVPKVRAVTSWIMTSPGNLADVDRSGLEAILTASPELAAVAESVRAPLLRHRPARRPGRFANGLSLRWSSGSVEGHVNRIKMLKRQSRVVRERGHRSPGRVPLVGRVFPVRYGFGHRGHRGHFPVRASPGCRPGGSARRFL